MFFYDVSVVIPTFNRQKFSKLIVENINSQTYPSIKEVLVGDDGDEPLDLSGCKYPIKYIKLPRISIGMKRNIMCQSATSRYIAFMDTDDLYHNDYISQSVYSLNITGKQLSGSINMLITDLEKTYIQQCSHFTMLNEATMVFEKEYFKTHKFSSVNSGEGREFCEEQYIIHNDFLMICIAHQENTIDKKNWLKDTAVIQYNLNVYKSKIDKIKM